MRRIRVVVLALLGAALFASPAHAQAPTYINLWNEALQRYFRAAGMADGTLYVTEKYPAEYQYLPQVIISGTVAANTTTALTPVTPFSSSSIYGLKWLNVIVSGAATNAPWRIKLFGSDDGVGNWAYLMDPNQSSSRWADSDTLMIRCHGNTPAGGLSFPIQTRAGYMIPHKFFGAAFSSDSTAGATMTVTVSVVGRQR